MFENLTKKFQDLFHSFAKGGALTEQHIEAAAEEVRAALLEADVNYTVAKNLMQRIKAKALGSALIKSVKPRQQFAKIVHEELMHIMGKDEAPLNFSKKPAIFMLCGLQGSGKTTHCVKLAHFIQKKGRKVLLAACDLQRPAAILQLQQLARQIDVPVFTMEDEKDPAVVAKHAKHYAAKAKFDALIVDTAGRLHIDETLMNELLAVKNCLQPQEVLFVASAGIGQDAAATALAFDRKVSITGTILTMLDSDARGGAALSIREVTGKPLKFEGIGEKIEDLQLFNPKSMADRITGMGDIINLVRRAQENFDEEEARETEKKLRKATFNYEDYLKQMGMIKKMGSMKGLLKMVPGFSQLKDLSVPEDQMKEAESIILSMTQKERQEAVELDYSRRKRLSYGAGVSIDAVNRLVKGFKRIKQLFKNMPNMEKKGIVPDMSQVSKLMGDTTWR